jgi:hypothetical protein
LAVERSSVPPPVTVSAPPPEITPTRVTLLPLVSTVLAPFNVMALSSDTAAAACSVVPLAKVSVPVPRAVLLPTASVPAVRDVPPE